VVTESGGDYQELPDVIAINVVAFDFPPARNYHTCFHMEENYAEEARID
jgi:hypothetical protein